jgi:outer membrane receptor protein involved in Fe transport
MRNTPNPILTAAICALLSSSAAIAQETAAATAESAADATRTAGLLTGKIVAQGSEAPVGGVLLTARSGATVLYARSDARGEFQLELPQGSYQVELTHPQFATINTKLAIQGGVEQQTQFTLSRGEENVEAVADTMDSVVVTGQQIRGSVDRERFSESVIDVLSAEDFKVTGDSDAVAALSRVTGLTVVNDKYVYVRGLGERYSNTTFNGATLPSPDPIRRVIPMDLFPTGVLEAVDIQKTYSPDLPGDFSGGTVQLRTSGVPEQSVRKFSVNVESNSETTGREALTYDGGGRDSLGYDDGDRDYPSELGQLTQGGAVPLSTLTAPGSLEAAGESLNNEYDTEIEELPANFGAEIGLGDRFEVGDNSVGYLFGARYDNDQSFRSEERRTTSLDGEGNTIARDDLRQSRTINTIDFSSLLNLEWEFSADNALRSSTFLTRSTDKRAIRTIGLLSENNIYVADTDLEWEERQLFTQQFSGEHTMPALQDLKISWQGTWSEAQRDKPDTRFYRYERHDEQNDLYMFSDVGDSNRRMWEDLTDESVSAGLDAELPIEFSATFTSTLKTGASFLDKDRDSRTRGYFYNTDFSQSGLRDDLALADPGQIFSDENIADSQTDGWQLRDLATATNDSYQASERNTAFYLMADNQLGDRLRLMFGARYEDSTLETESYRRTNPTDVHFASLEEDDILPAVTATWSFSDSMQVRFGYGETLNRPDLRELTDAEFLEPEERYLIRGNPNLRTAHIKNYDVRWEWYWSSVDNVQLAVFYKDFEDPIERIIRLGAGGVREFVNADSGENQGVELQVRSGLGFVADPLTDFFVKLNGAYIDSEVVVNNPLLTNPTHALEGQSPWVVNLQLGYDNPTNGIQAALLFNMADDRIVDLGTQGLPDAYEQSVARLDFNYRQPIELFGQSFTLKVKGLNLLDPDYEVTRGSVVERSFQRGVTGYVGIDFEF